jgi:hypothetical protein
MEGMHTVLYIMYVRVSSACKPQVVEMLGCLDASSAEDSQRLHATARELLGCRDGDGAASDLSGLRYWSQWAVVQHPEAGVKEIATCERLSGKTGRQ